jgi:hypothetical protein
MLAGQWAGDCCNPTEQLLIKQEILPKRLAGGKTMPCDHLAQRW